MNRSSPPPYLQASLFLLVCGITTLIYWPGLHGPFLLDDIPNLKPLKHWLDGLLTWQGVVFDNRSGPLGRPLSMASFLMDTALTGNMHSFTFKPTNLLIHLLCGTALLFLSRLLFARDPRTTRHAGWLALLVATCWLWLPLSTSTVLYVIQRMAQLSALFILLTLLVYMLARRRIEQQRPSGYAMLWIGVPLMTLLGALSKENGLLAPFLAAVLEWTIYASCPSRPRPRGVRAFFLVAVWLPGAAIVAWLAIHPHYITNGYRLRDFTLGERLLTEPRILWSYVQTMLFPVGRDMGLYHDNYAISTSLMHPWTTLPALAGWIVLTVTAFVLRKRQPLFAAGVGLFLAGHAMESSIFALELYFEHRNYFPGIGILIAMVGTVVVIIEHMPTPGTHFRRVCGVLLAAMLLSYAAGTRILATSWSSAKLFYTMQANYNPASPRLQSDLAANAMMAGNLQSALQHITMGERHSPAKELMTSTIWRFLAYCATSHTPPANLYTQFASRSHGAITKYSMLGWEQLAGKIEHGCPGIRYKQLAALGGTWINRSPLPDHSQNMWRPRYDLARIVAAGGNIQKAATIAHKAWVDSSYNNGIGVLLFQLNATLGNVDMCRKVLSHLEQAYGGSNARLNQAVVTFRKALANGEIGKPSPASSKPAS